MSDLRKHERRIVDGIEWARVDCKWQHAVPITDENGKPALRFEYRELDHPAMMSPREVRLHGLMNNRLTGSPLIPPLAPLWMNVATWLIYVAGKSWLKPQRLPSP